MSRAKLITLLEVQTPLLGEWFVVMQIVLAVL